MKTLSVKNPDNPSSLPSAIYVIVSANLEYNDCTYDMFGEFLHKTKFFFSEDEALENYVDILKNFYGDLRVYELSDLILFDNVGFIESIVTDEHNKIAANSEMLISTLLDNLDKNSSTGKKFIYDTFRSLLQIVKLEK